MARLPSGSRGVLALCVGASTYRDNDIRDLPFAERDAVTISGDLARCGGYDVIGTLTGRSVTQAAVEDWLFRRLPARRGRETTW